MLSRNLASLAKCLGIRMEAGPARGVWHCQQQLQQPQRQYQCRTYSSGTLDDHQDEVPPLPPMPATTRRLCCLVASSAALILLLSNQKFASGRNSS
jgi:hypothetical protein